MGRGECSAVAVVDEGAQNGLGGGGFKGGGKER